MPGNYRAESEDTSQDEKTRQLGLRGIIILTALHLWVTFVCSQDNTFILFMFLLFRDRSVVVEIVVHFCCRFLGCILQLRYILELPGKCLDTKAQC